MLPTPLRRSFAALARSGNSAFVCFIAYPALLGGTAYLATEDTLSTHASADQIARLDATRRELQSIQDNLVGQPLPKLPHHLLKYSQEPQTAQEINDCASYARGWEGPSMPINRSSFDACLQMRIWVHTGHPEKIRANDQSLRGIIVALSLLTGLAVGAAHYRTAWARRTQAAHSASLRR